MGCQPIYMEDIPLKDMYKIQQYVGIFLQGLHCEKKELEALQNFYRPFKISI